MGETTKNRILMGIDPGSNIMGYAFISITTNKPKLIQFGTLNFSKEKNHYLKLKRINEEVSKLIEEYLPDELAIEAPFYGKNIQSMLMLGRAQGACITAALQKDIPIFEYAPKRVKQSITGNGNSSKEQVAKMLKNIFTIHLNISELDATDALSVALCHFYSKGKVNSTNRGKSNNWSAFVKNNPSRLK